jgi:anti-sigma-K factor RskA
MSTDLHTLSGAYALDALSVEEAQLFDTHLEQCEACREEVRELRNAAARMGASEALVPPAALKARILAAADRQPQLPPKVSPIGASRARRRLPQLIAAAVAAVLVLGAGFGIIRGQQDQHVVAATVSQVFKASDARTKTVQTDHGKLTVAASPGLGKMAVRTDGLRPLASRMVYQLWTIQSGRSTSVGIVNDLAAGKAMAIPSSGTTVAITIEPAGGSDQPTTTPIVTVDPASV